MVHNELLAAVGETMLRFDPSEISNWASLPDANHQLPELIRRLILATVPQLSRLDIPSGSAVWLSGWDGLLTAETGNAWVPEGTSAWELSCRSDTGAKANDDYRKRTKTPQGVAVATSTFVFVTPRQWTGKQRWLEQRCAEGKWADVRAFDASDLAAWLYQAPAVAEWFARLINKLPTNGYTTLDEWWENWATTSRPNISPALALAGRQEIADRVAEWIQQTATPYYVQAQTREEAISFMAACALNSDDSWGATLLAKALVVKSEDAWNSLVRHTSPLVLIRAFDGNVSSQVATNRGHHVMTPLHANAEPRGNGARLPILGRDETITELTEMGMSEASARALARKTARSLPIMRRFLIDEAEGPTPEWASVDPQSALPSLMLIGQWDESNENDKETVVKITGRPYEEVVRESAALAQNEDSPLTKIGSRWRFLSHEEAWHLLAPRLTAVDVERFTEEAVRVLGAESTAYELPVEERHLAGIHGKGVPHSSLLHDGIARTLALMGNQGERAKNVEDVPYRPGIVLRRVLTDDKGWEVWATLSRDLATLAEAAPEAVLGAIERCLTATPSPFEDLFAQEGDPLFVGASHTGLLWALERLAWSPEYFARVANVLARLALIDPSGRVTNRPVGSLADTFLPWFRLSEATDDDRLTVLGMLLSRFPEPGWKTLLRAYPSFLSDTVVSRQPPSWRPWRQDGVPRPTQTERRAFVKELERLLLENVGDIIGRWKDTVSIIANLSPDARQRAIALLAQRVNEMRKHPDSSELWEALRMELNRQRSHPDAQWAMPTADVELLEAVYRELTPDNPAAAYAWVFDWHPYLPEGNSYEAIERGSKIDAARQSAIAAAYEKGRTEAVLSIAACATQPAAVGHAFATNVETERALAFALEHTGSENQKYRQMAHGILWELFRQSGWPVLEDTIARLKETDYEPEAVANVFLVAPPAQDTWERLADEEPDVQGCYWQGMNPWGVSREEHASFVVEKLLAVQRSVTVAQWTAHSPVHHEIVIRTLEQLPADLAASTEPKPGTDGIIYDIVKLLEKLDHSDEVGDDTIARLELPFISALGHCGRPNLAIYREIAKEPSLFADLIASTYRREDGQPDPMTDGQPSQVTTKILVQIISGSGEIPGNLGDGTVDYEAMATWVNEARRLCADRGRGEVGDTYIGNLLAKAPAGPDGIWPCEPVRELLDSIGSPDIGEGFVTGKINLRGGTTRGVFEGGTQEHTLADRYLQQAAAIGSRWPFTATLLRSIAQWYEQTSKRHDREADERNQFEF